MELNDALCLVTRAKTEKKTLSRNGIEFTPVTLTAKCCITATRRPENDFLLVTIYFRSVVSNSKSMKNTYKTKINKKFNSYF